MPVPVRLIRRRVKSVGNTRKITKAMELVSATKMRRTVRLATQARRFASLGAALLQGLTTSGVTVSHPLMRTTSTHGVTLCIVIASDRGLCGAYNAQLLRIVQTVFSASMDVHFITIGRFAETALRRAGRTIIASFPGMTNTPRVADVRPLVSLCITEFTSGIYNRVMIATTKYQSALRQTPQMIELLPIAAPTGAEAASHLGDAVFEPTPAQVLEYTLPRFIESTVYQAVLEAAASEHSSRMLSMRAASHAARDMIADLTFTLNQARQSAITSEIAEISAGRAALEG